MAGAPKSPTTAICVVGAIEVDARLELVEFVLDLLARHAARAAREHVARERTGGRGAEERLLVAEVQRDPRVHCCTASALGEQRYTHAVRELRALRARVDVLRRGIERLARG